MMLFGVKEVCTDLRKNNLYVCNFKTYINIYSVSVGTVTPMESKVHEVIGKEDLMVAMVNRVCYYDQEGTRGNCVICIFRESNS